MKRSKRILVVAGCILNANAKITPLATYGGANLDFLLPYMQKGCGIVQLPCPETAFLGMTRWGMTREQYDQPMFRQHCRTIIQPVLLELEAYATAGYEFEGVAGVKGSPSCGVTQTCFGFSGGEVGCGDFRDQLDRLCMAEGTGVFMQELKQAVQARGLDLEFFDVADPDSGL